MSEKDVAKTEETAEKEIVIEIDAKESDKNDTKDGVLTEEEPKPKLANKFVEPKQVVDLTDDERALIVANAKAGLDQPNFNVKFFKNGKYRIVKKKATTPTVSQKAITSTPPKETEKKVYYSDNQLLFEHIIELNAKVEKLMAKHKKLKRRYQSLQNDIYIDDNESNEPVDVKVDEKVDDKSNEHVDVKLKGTVDEPKTTKQKQQNAYVQPVSRSWRARLTYL